MAMRSQLGGFFEGYSRWGNELAYSLSGVRTKRCLERGKGYASNGNPVNLMTGSGMQQAHSLLAEETVKALRKREGGTR